MSTQTDELRNTMGAPTLLEIARESQRMNGDGGSGEGGGGGENQWKVKRLNPNAPNEEGIDDGRQRKERQVVQKDGVVQDDEGVEDVRGAASFLGKKLFGERFSGNVDEDGRQKEGKGRKADEGASRNRNASSDQSTAASGDEAGDLNGKQDGADDASGKKGVRVTKTAKSGGLSRDDIAAVVEATVKGLKPSIEPSSSDVGDGAGSSHDPNQAVIESLSAKDRTKYQIVSKMAEMNESYKDLPSQFVEFQKAKAQYAADYKKENGSEINWSDEEHQDWIASNQPEFDEEDYVDARIELRADAVSEKRMRSVEEKLADANRKATEGTLRERMTATAKQEITAFAKDFVPEADWDLTTPEGRQAAEEEDPVLGGVAARWAETLSQASERLIRLYDGGGLWKADMSDTIDRYLATLAQNWEAALAKSPIENTVNKDGKRFATRAEYRRMSKEQQDNHWIIGRDEMLWILPRDIKAKADVEKNEELERLQKIASARGWKFDPESITTQKRRVRSNPDGIDEEGQTATRSAQQERAGYDFGRAPSSTSGSKVSTDAQQRQQQNKSFSALLAKKLFGRQSGDSE